MISAMKNTNQGHRDERDRRAIVVLPKISAYPSRKVWVEACWQKLLHYKDWLNQIITPYELYNIVMRTAVAHRLQTGISYRDIGRELWLSPQTISVIKKSLGEKGYRSYAERGKTERRKKVYSVDHSMRPHRRLGAPHKTKYGTVYL